MATGILYLIRHGLIWSNVEHVYAGRTAERLTEQGMRQANQVGREMKDWGISTVYASPLARTIQTAEILNRHLRAELVLEPDILEMDLGPWTGLSKSEVMSKFPREYRTWAESPSEFMLEGMETLQDVLRRTIRFLVKLRTEKPAETTAAVTHSVVIRCAILYCNNLPLNSYGSLIVPNLSVHRIIFDTDGGSIERVR